MEKWVVKSSLFFGTIIKTRLQLIIKSFSLASLGKQLIRGALLDKAIAVAADRHRPAAGFHTNLIHQLVHHL